MGVADEVTWAAARPTAISSPFADPGTREPEKNAVNVQSTQEERAPAGRPGGSGTRDPRNPSVAAPPALVS